MDIEELFVVNQQLVARLILVVSTPFENIPVKTTTYIDWFATSWEIPMERYRQNKNPWSL